MAKKPITFPWGKFIFMVFTLDAMKRSLQRCMRREKKYDVIK